MRSTNIGSPLWVANVFPSILIWMFSALSCFGLQEGNQTLRNNFLHPSVWKAVCSCSSSNDLPHVDWVVSVFEPRAAVVWQIVKAGVASSEQSAVLIPGLFVARFADDSRSSNAPCIPTFYRFRELSFVARNGGKPCSSVAYPLFGMTWGNCFQRSLFTLQDANLSTDRSILLALLKPVAGLESVFQENRSTGIQTSYSFSREQTFSNMTNLFERIDIEPVEMSLVDSWGQFLRVACPSIDLFPAPARIESMVRRVFSPCVLIDSIVLRTCDMPGNPNISGFVEIYARLADGPVRIMLFPKPLENSADPNGDTSQFFIRRDGLGCFFRDDSDSFPLFF